MQTDVILYTQIISIVVFVTSPFVLYRLLVSQKDAVIQMLKQKIELLEQQLKDGKNDSPDVLVDSLSKRVEASINEIVRLRTEGEEYKGQANEIENELKTTKSHLDKINTLLVETDLLCPHCKAPLLRRHCHIIHGVSNGRDVEADIEITEYECGYIIDSGDLKKPEHPPIN